MRTKQGTYFVRLLYAKQILMQKYINIDTQFLGRAEGSFQDGQSRIKYFAISDKIYDLKNNVNFEPRIQKVTISEKKFWTIFATFNFVIVLLAAQVNRKIESDIEFSGRRDQVTTACLLAKH